MLKMTHEHMLLRPIEEQKTDSGLLVASGNKTRKALILGMGRYCSRLMEVGDTVIYNKVLMQITFEGHECVIVEESEVLGVFKSDDWVMPSFDDSECE
jgi:co-chaperonin GroES (HSP10)